EPRRLDGRPDRRDAPMPRTTDRLHVGLMLALSFSTGIVDAVGYLGLDRVFTANMTGNVVILAMGLTGSGHLPVIGPLIALAALAFDSWLGRRTGQQWVRRLSAVTLLALGALVGAALLLLFFWLGLGLAALILVVVALLGHLGHRRTRIAADQ